MRPVVAVLLHEQLQLQLFFCEAKREDDSCVNVRDGHTCWAGANQAVVDDVLRVAEGAEALRAAARAVRRKAGNMVEQVLNMTKHGPLQSRLHFSLFEYLFCLCSRVIFHNFNLLKLSKLNSVN